MKSNNSIIINELSINLFYFDHTIIDKLHYDILVKYSRVYILHTIILMIYYIFLNIL